MSARPECLRWFELEEGSAAQSIRDQALELGQQWRPHHEAGIFTIVGFSDDGNPFLRSEVSGKQDAFLRETLYTHASFVSKASPFLPKPLAQGSHKLLKHSQRDMQRDRSLASGSWL